MSIAIKVENLSKAYQIGQIGTGTISRDLERWWTTKVRGKEDPFLKIGETNDRSVKGTSNIVWSLKDINFESQQGDIVGIIGKNGAGKSTLLKLLTRITSPTTGKIKIKGRVASLLEVGTGFHPELTGKENIYLNGSILGMRYREITRKLDEIIDFSGIERYIDTPVKRYSSGMYVRLAFAVAAHLESEILIIDEVLAVGDAEFQKKCLGKIQSVSRKEARTVLFVSHNMAAVKAICQRGIILKNGLLEYDGDSNSAIDYYLQGGSDLSVFREWITEEMPGNDNIKIRRAAVYAQGKSVDDPILTKDDLVFEVEFYNNSDNAVVDVTWDLVTAQGVHVAHLGNVCDFEGLPRGWHKSTTVLPGYILNTDRYFFNVMFGKNQREVLFQMEEILTFDMNDGIENRGSNYRKLPGIIHPRCDWKTQSVSAEEKQAA